MSSNRRLADEVGIMNIPSLVTCSRGVWLLLFVLAPCRGFAADKLVGIHSARTMSQSMPWIAEEAGLFKKYGLDFQLVYISSASMVTAAMLSGSGDVAISGGEAIVRASIQGVKELVFIAAAKNSLTHSILARPEIRRPEDLKGKTLGLTRIGSNSHYFVVQALRRYGLEAADVNFIQTGGQVENLTALLTGKVDAATMTGPSGGAKAIAEGFRYAVYGPDLQIPFAAAMLVTRRALLRTQAPVLEKFMHAMTEAVKIMFKDKELTYKILGKYLRISDRKILDAAYDEEIKVMEPKMEFKLESIQAIVDETAKADPRAIKVKPHDLIDRSLLDKLQKDGFFDKLWTGK
jgi:NitT/TauT family transport system substrate-binding protein